MKKYPQTWRINDWDKPWLPLPARIINRLPKIWLDKLLPFDCTTMLEQARRHTGLSDFGDEDFLQPLGLLCEEIQASKLLNPLGHITAREIFRQQLCSRLCVEDLFTRKPELHETPVESPLFIAGLPRTGTTHLHNLLSCVSSLKYIPFWQTMAPVANHKKHKNIGASIRARRRINRFNTFFADYLLPLYPRMHEMVLDMPHEELTLCALSFRSFIFEGAYRVPRYRAWYASEDNTAGYQYLKKTLQAIDYENELAKNIQYPGKPENKENAKRWILKSPQHVDQLPAILNTFPDAKIILTHRDPARAVLSMITMMVYTSREVYWQDDRLFQAKAWVDRLEDMLRASQHQASKVPASQIMNVYFDDFMANQEQTIKNILEFADIEMDKNSITAIKKHLQSHTRDRHGRIDYNFEDLGLNENEIRERFSFYQP